MTNVLKLLKFTEELNQDFKPNGSTSTALDQMAAASDFDAKFLKLFHDNFKKDFKWVVPGT